MKKGWFIWLLIMAVMVSMLSGTSAVGESGIVGPFVTQTDRTLYAEFLSNPAAAISHLPVSENIRQKYEREYSKDDNPESLLNSRWMSLISGERYLNEINIPGTHDSGMRDPESLYTSIPIAGAVWELGEEVAKTQHTYLDEQLKMGIRAFDIRLHYLRQRYRTFLDIVETYSDKSDLWVVHGKNEALRFWGQNRNGKDLPLSQVFDMMKSFLKKNPSETVIIYLRPETEDGDDRQIIMDLAKKFIVKNLAEINPSTGKPYLYYFPDQHLDWPEGLMDIPEEPKFTGNLTEYLKAVQEWAENIQKAVKNNEKIWAKYDTTPQQYPRLEDCRGQVLIECSADYGLVGLRGDYIAFDADYMNVARKQEDSYNALVNDKLRLVKEFYSKETGLPFDTNTRIDKLYDMWLNTTEGRIYEPPYLIAEEVNPKLFGTKKLFDLNRMNYLGWVYMDGAYTSRSKYIWSSNFLREEDCVMIRVNSGTLRDNTVDITYYVPKNMAFVIPGCIFQMTDEEMSQKTFVGYQVSGEGAGKNAGRIYQPREIYSATGNVLFTAVWSEDGNAHGFGMVGSGSYIPQTGDSSHPLLWIGFVAVGMVILAVAVLAGKRSRKTGKSRKK